MHREEDDEHRNDPPSVHGTPRSLFGRDLPAELRKPGSSREPEVAHDIVTRAGMLKARVEAWTADGTGLDPAFPASDAFRALKSEAEALAALDLQAHHWLAQRDADGDLKCILRGIAEDMPVRLAAIETTEGPARAEALAELAHLLDDNVAVILAPPPPAA